MTSICTMGSLLTLMFLKLFYIVHLSFTDICVARVCAHSYACKCLQRQEEDTAYIQSFEAGLIPELGMGF